jgi:osmotically-inducible protein OsmY
MARYGEGWSGRWEGGFRPRGDEWQVGESVYGPERYGLGPYHERLRRRRRPDDELKREVEEALFMDSWVDADAISVAVRDGVVTLTGTLPDYDEIRYATDDVWDVVGVLGVLSELTVRE